MRYIATDFPQHPAFTVAANQNESPKTPRPRGENPFKGGKRNSAFWAILTTLDPECATDSEEKREGGRRRGIYCEFVPSSSLARDTACQKLENRNGNKAFRGMGKIIAKFHQLCHFCFFCCSHLRHDMLHDGPNSNLNRAG